MLGLIATLHVNATSMADTRGLTCIHSAIKYCSKEILQAIIGHGADINATCKNNVTALMLACLSGNIEAINVLLKAGADISIASVDGATWIHCAVDGTCSRETLKAVISHGADVNTTGNNNVTALMMACWKGNVDAIHALLNAGADPNITDIKGATCILYAVDGDCSKETIQAIISRGADVNATDNSKLTPLIIACQKGYVDVVNVLLNAGADCNIADGQYGKTCIHTAIIRGCCKELLENLIDHGADVNATDKDSQTALMTACWKGNVEAINVLLNAEANPNITDNNGATWIHYAVAGDYSKATLLKIIEHGANVDVTRKRNITALMIACKMGNADAINVLLKVGADPHIRDIDGATWIHYAVGGDCSKETIQTIIDHGADVNTTNKQCVTALMVACQKRNIEAIDVLLNAGANVNVVDVIGETCLHAAVRGHCSKEVLQALIDHGVDVNVRNKKSGTAIMIAFVQALAKREWLKENLDAINLLLNAGAHLTLFMLW